MKRTTFLTIASTCFPALDVCYTYSPRVLNGTLRYLCLLRLVRVVSLVSILRHSIGHFHYGTNLLQLQEFISLFLSSLRFVIPKNNNNRNYHEEITT